MLAAGLASMIPTAAAQSMPPLVDGRLPVFGSDASPRPVPSHAEAEATGSAHVEAALAWRAAAPPEEAPATGVGGARPAWDGSDAEAALGSLLGALLLAYLSRLKFWLLSAGPVALFSRIEPERVLENGVRQRIHEAIARNPGITLTEVARACAVGWGTAVFHLGRLESHGLVASERHRRRRRYFAQGAGLANAAKAAYAELLDPTSQRIAAEVLERPGAAQKDVCAALGLLAPRASKHLSALERASLVLGRREANRVRYFPTPRLAELFRLLDAAVLA
jgi:predicted transcriptional regulator